MGRLILLPALCVALAFAVSAQTEKPAGVSALIVTGGHDHDAAFYALFEGGSEITANVDPHPMPYRRGDLRQRYDVLVLYDSVQEITDQERRTLVSFLESGKGLVVLHHALVDYCNWTWWWRDVMGARWIQTDDPLVRWKTTYKHDVDMTVEPAADHPVTAGVGTFRITDETYKGMWLAPGNKVLMRTGEATSDGPVAWISPYRKSRVVVIELGHDRKAHLNPAYRRLVRNAVVWAGGK
jgi:type 1 glutamine amidotransferase